MSSVSIEPLNARRPRRDPEPSDQTSSASRVEGEDSQPAAKKNIRGPSRMLKQSQSVRQTNCKIKITYPEIACLHVPHELKDRPKDWEWLYKHFTDSKFVKKSVAGQKARESKTLLHHSGSMPFSYRLKARCEEGSMFPEIDMFKDVYVRPGNETSKQLHAIMVEKSTAILEEATSQLPSETPIEDVTIPENVGFQIMTDVLDQNFDRRRGKVVRCMGKARVHEMGASSSRSNTAEVNALKEEVTQLRAQGEQMRAQLRAEG